MMVTPMPSPARRIEIFTLDTVPEIQPGNDLAGIIVEAASDVRSPLKDGDVLVVAQKIVSKSEGRIVLLEDVEPSAEALSLANETEKDPRLVELILSEATEIVRSRPGLIIARHRNGCVVANAAIDASNAGNDGSVILLPENADQSAKTIAENIYKLAGTMVAVVINDSMGRAWRKGTTGTAIGSYGLEALQDRRGDKDRDGMELQSSEIAISDEVAAAGSLLMGQGAEGLPVVILRGVTWANGNGSAVDLVRPPEQDLFR